VTLLERGLVETTGRTRATRYWWPPWSCGTQEVTVPEQAFPSGSVAVNEMW